MQELQNINWKHTSQKSQNYLNSQLPITLFNINYIFKPTIRITY